MSDLPSLEAFSAALGDLAAAAAPSIVSVHSHRALSSGFVWRDGLIVTADEALAEEGDIAVTLPSGEQHQARLAGSDPSTDIALLRIEGDSPPAFPLNAGPIRPAGLALVVAARQGAPLVALGSVAFAGPAWRSMRGGEIDARIELDVRPGRQAEGGLVLDAAGRGIGMAVFGPRRSVLVIPGATIDRVAARLATDGKIPRGYLGLGLQPVRLDGGGTGLMVMGVDASGPGAAAGVRQGDVIVAWDGAPAGALSTLMRALGPGSVGRVLPLGLRRGGQPVEVSLTVGERPST